MSVIQTTVIREEVREVLSGETALEGSVQISRHDGTPATDGEAGFQCQACGEPARVQVLTGYSNAGPLFRRLCLHCEQHEMRGSYQPGRRRHLRAWLLTAMVGGILVTIGVFGDWLIPQRHLGFGWYQGWGVILGLVSGLFGLLLGADLVALAGGMLFCAAASADWFGLTQKPGIGPEQQCLILAGEIFILLAVLLYKRSLLFGKRGNRSVKESLIPFSPGLAASR